MNLAELLSEVRQRLFSHSETAALDAQVLLAWVINRPRAWVMAHPELKISKAQSQQVENALRQLESGIPLPYIIGQWEFYGLDFTVSPAVLIPRPETELLVQAALDWLQGHSAREEQSHPLLAADVGTGSGCIAISLSVYTPDLRLIACDYSRAALEIARRNALHHQVGGRIGFVESDLLSGFANTPVFNLICANLPYIPTDRLRHLAVYGREPALALDGGEQGLQVIQRLMAESQVRLAPGGLLLLEIDASQGNAVKAMASQAFPDAEIAIQPDLAGRDRIASIHLPG